MAARWFGRRKPRPVTLARQKNISTIMPGHGRLELHFLPMPKLPWLLTPGNILWKVQRLSAFWEAPKTLGGVTSLWRATERLMQGLQQPFGFLMLYHQRQLQVGWVNDSRLSLQGALEACYPGLMTAPLADGVRRLLSAVPPFQAALQVSGNPFNPKLSHPDSDTYEPPGLDRLVQGLASHDWLYVVLAFPLDANWRQAELRRLYRQEMEIRARYLRPGTALEENNPEARYYLQQVEAAKAKMEEGLRIGLWETVAVLFLSALEALGPGVNLLKSIFAGEDSLPQPIIIQPYYAARSDSMPGSQFLPTILNSRDVARFVLIPRQDYQGYPVRPFAPFNLHQAQPQTARQLFLGNLITSPKAPVYLDVDQLPKHTLIAGSTGAGKTNTCLSWLYQAWKRYRIPFLILETSEKREYGESLKKFLGTDLEIFTVGDESQKPLHLNILEAPPNIHVEAHLGRLMQIFKAAFPLPSPTPYLLEEALRLWYERRGWNLEQNKFFAPGQPMVFDDLIEIIRQLLTTKYAHYDGEMRGNIEAALLARLTSLNRGGTKYIFNSPREQQTPWDHLLTRPVVLELATLTDPEKKALAVLFILYRLMSSAQKEYLCNPHRLHLTVIEEAHRVLTQRQASQHPDVVDTQAVTVEAFAHALAEVRGAREGLIILDQMPSRLSPAVRSNTNQKLVFRLPDEEEQKVFAQAAGLTDQQKQLLYRLTPGEALWFPADGSVFLLCVPPFPPA